MFDLAAAPLFYAIDPQDERLRLREKYQRLLDKRAEKLLEPVYLRPLNDTVTFEYRNWQLKKTDLRKPEMVIARQSGLNQQGLLWERAQYYYPKRLEPTWLFIRRAVKDWLKVIENKGPVSA